MLSEAGGGVETSLGQMFVDGGVARPGEENSPVRNRSSALIPRSFTPGPVPFIDLAGPLETAHCRVISARNRR